MQTTDRPPALDGPEGPRPESRLSRATWVALGVLAIPVVALAVVSRVGVIAGIVLALLAGLALWVMRRGFAFYEIVAFLIHFDGIGMGPIRMGRVVAGIAVIYFVYKLVVERWRPPAIPTRHWIMPFLLVLMTVVSGIWSSSLSGWLFGVANYGLAVVYFAVAALLTDGWDKVQKMVRAYWVGGLFGASAGVLAIVLGTRSWGFGGDANYFGLLMASMIPLTVYYRRQSKDRREKFWYTAALIFVFAGAAGAGSRSGVIGASVVIVATMVSRPGESIGRRIRTFILAVVLAGIAFVVLFVANPANLERGFNDRGSGRLDIWTASIALVQERPVIGWGAGQLSEQIPDALPVTPGVERPVERGDREKVAAHNTWIEIFGDFGVIGFVIWNTMLVITAIGLLRPRWPQAKRLSIILAVMMAPVMSSSFLLPMMNKKLPWLLIGLAASLQVPSWGARWRGFLSASVPALPQISSASGRADSSAHADGTGTRHTGTGHTVTATGGNGMSSGSRGTNGNGSSYGGNPSRPAPVAGIELAPYQSAVLARWDVKVSQRFRNSIILGTLGGFMFVFVLMSAVPTRYVASGGIVVPELTKAGERRVVSVDDEQVQALHTIVASPAYAEELRQLSGLDMTTQEIQERVKVDRPKFSNFLQLTFTDTDEDNAIQALPYMVDALDAVVATARQGGYDMSLDEFRPIVPGETVLYTGPLYFRAYTDGVLEVEEPRVLTSSLVGAASGALLAVGFLLLQQRRPRINNDDDLRATLGLPVWTHVGRAGRRYGASRDQYLQVMTVAEEVAPVETLPRRLVISTPKPDRAARGLAMGVAAALASEGRRVVLVDAQVDKPLLSYRLGGWWARGLLQAMEGSVPLESTLRRVNRWRMPRSARRLLRHHSDLIRFLPAGTIRGVDDAVRPRVLDRFDEDITLVVLAPSLMGRVPAGPLLAWADATVLALVEGRTVTFDAEDGAARLQPFFRGRTGVVLLDV